MSDSTLLYKGPCTSCGSSDACAVYDDGHTHCFSCNATRQGGKNSDSKAENRRETPMTSTVKTAGRIAPIPDTFGALEDRGISAKAAAKYGVTYNSTPTNPMVHLYPYTRDGAHVANKGRARSTKDFRWQGDSTNLDLFGQSAFPAGSAKSLTIVEGECDAMAAYQMNGGYPVVSVQNASSAVKDVLRNFEYVNSYDEVVLCFDKDKGVVRPDGTTHYPGQEAALALAEKLPVGKVRIMTPSLYKDANDYLRAGQGQAFVKEWWNAPAYTPAGLKMADALWDDVINPPQYETLPYPWKGLEGKTYGIRLSEMVVVNAQPKIGKSTFLGEITHHLLMNTDAMVGLMRLEESTRDSILNLMSIHTSKRLHLPDVWESTSKDELRDAFDNVTRDGRVVLFDHFGSTGIDVILDKIRHMAAMGCKYIILDHLSIIVSGSDGDERKQLDQLTTKLKTLTMELNIALVAVVHQNRQGSIRGTAGVEQLANLVIRLERDKEATDELERNTMKVVISENRFCGETGLACYLHFSQETGRLTEIPESDFELHKGSNESPDEWLDS